MSRKVNVTRVNGMFNTFFISLVRKRFHPKLIAFPLFMLLPIAVYKVR